MYQQNRKTSNQFINQKKKPGDKVFLMYELRKPGEPSKNTHLLARATILRLPQQGISNLYKVRVDAVKRVGVENLNPSQLIGETLSVSDRKFLPESNISTMMRDSNWLTKKVVETSVVTIPYDLTNKTEFPCSRKDCQDRMIKVLVRYTRPEGSVLVWEAECLRCSAHKRIS